MLALSLAGYFFLIEIRGNYELGYDYKLHVLRGTDYID